MIVRYTRRAQHDLQNILKYIDERSPRGASNVKLAIKRAIDMIGENPGVGHPTGEGATRDGHRPISFPCLLDDRRQ